MTDFKYTLNIPNGPNNPSNDQPIMQTNNNSNALIWDVDHYGFNNINGGLHAQSTYPLITTPATPTGLASVAYTSPGLADSTTAEYLYKNSSATFPLSSIKAFCLFVSSATQPVTNIIPANQFNINGNISQVPGGGSSLFTININPGVLPTVNAAVFITINNFTGTFTYGFTSTTQLLIQTSSASALSKAISILIIQI